MKPKKFKDGDISTNDPSSFRNSCEMSPLFRDYGLEVIKQSPLLRGNLKKYGSEKSNSLTKPLRKQWFSGASANLSSSVHKRRNEVQQLLPQNYLIPLPGNNSKIPNRANGRQHVTDDYSVLNGDNDGVKAISSPSIRTRQPPQTKLESLGSTSTWRILLLPAITLAFTLLFHPSCIQTTELKVGSCLEPFECDSFTDFSDEEGINVAERIVIKRFLDTSKFIYISMYMDDLGNTTEPKSAVRRLEDYNNTNNYYEIKTRLFTVDALEYEKYLISEGTELSRGDFFTEAIKDNTTLLSDTTKICLLGVDRAEPMILLDFTSFFQTGYLKGNYRYPVVDISLSTLQPPSPFAVSSLYFPSSRRLVDSQVTAEEFQKADTALANMRILVSTQGSSYTIWSCLLNLILSSIAVVMLVVSLLRVILHIKFILGIERKTLEILVTMKSNKNEELFHIGDDDENLVSTTDYILRRYHSLVLNEKKDMRTSAASKTPCPLPVSSFFHWMELLLPEQFVSFSLLTALIFWLNPFSAMLTLLSLMTQMNWFKGNLAIPDILLFIFKLTEALGRQGLLFSILILIEGLKYTPVTIKPHRNADKEPTTSMESNTNFTNIAGTENRNGNKKLSLLATTNPFDSPTVNNEVAENDGKDMQERMGKLNIEDINNTNSDDNRNDITDDISNVSSSLSCEKEKIFEEKCRTHVPNFGNRSILANHHPMSPCYFEFIWKKLGFLFLSFYCVLMFWVFQSPQIFLASEEDEINQWLVLTLSNTFGMAVTFITLTWMILIIKATFTTEHLIRRIRYRVSRFRQIFFRLLMSQLSLGITTAVIYILIQIYNFIVLLDETSENSEEYDNFNENVINDIYITRFLRKSDPSKYAPSVTRASFFTGNKGLSSFGADNSNEKALKKIVWILGIISGFEAEPLVSWYLQGSHLAVTAFITAICCTTAFVLLPPRSIQFSPNCCSCIFANGSILPSHDSVNQREYNDISDVDNYVQDISSGVMTDLKGTSHAFVALEKDMTHNDQSSKSCRIGKKTTFSVIDTLKNARNGKRESRKREMFCLETACILMEASYQAYFPLPKEYQPLSVEYDDQKKFTAEVANDDIKSKTHDQDSVDSLMYTQSHDEKILPACISPNAVSVRDGSAAMITKETANVAVDKELSPLFDISPKTSPFIYNSYPTSSQPMSKLISNEIPTVKIPYSNDGSESSLEIKSQILFAQDIDGHTGAHKIDPMATSLEAPVKRPPIASPLAIGPRMDLPRIGLQLLSHFSNKEHNTFGYVATSPILPSFSLLCPHLGPDHALVPSKLPLRALIEPTLNQNGRAEILKPSNSAPSSASDVTARNSGQFYTPISTPSSTKTNNKRPFILDALDKTVIDKINPKNADVSRSDNDNNCYNTLTTEDTRSDSKDDKTSESGKTNSGNIIGDRIVTSFRGSVMANIFTDLKVGQVLLPCLRHSKKHFIKMIQEIQLEEEIRKSNTNISKQNGDIDISDRKSVLEETDNCVDEDRDSDINTIAVDGKDDSRDVDDSNVANAESLLSVISPPDEAIILLSRAQGKDFDDSSITHIKDVIDTSERLMSPPTPQSMISLSKTCESSWLSPLSEKMLDTVSLGLYKPSNTKYGPKKSVDKYKNTSVWNASEFFTTDQSDLENNLFLHDFDSSRGSSACEIERALERELNDSGRYDDNEDKKAERSDIHHEGNRTDCLKSKLQRTVDSKTQKEEKNESYWYSGVKIVLSSLPVFQHTLPRVHEGFWEAYSSVREDVLKSIVKAISSHYLQHNELLQRINQYQDKKNDPSDISQNQFQSISNELSKPLKIYFCGHSLGAALAVLAALDVSVNMNYIVDAIKTIGRADGRTEMPLNNSFDETYLKANKVSLCDVRWEVPTLAVYTYGAPRIGNTIFAAFVNRKIPSSYRVEVDTDIVTVIPKVFRMYRHAGIPVVVDSDEAGSIIVKPTIIESQLFRANASKGSLSSHLLSKYRSSLEACFEEKEYKEYVQRAHSHVVHNEYSDVYGNRNRIDSALSPPRALPGWLIERRRGIDLGQEQGQGISENDSLMYTPDNDSDNRKGYSFQNRNKKKNDFQFENNRSSFRDEKYRSNDWQYSAKKAVTKETNWWQ